MPARHEQRQKRKRGRLILKHRRQQMAFHVVNRYDRAIPGEAEARCRTAAHHQRTHEPGTGRVGDGIRLLDTRFAKNLLNQRQDAPQVIPRRNLGDNPAVHRMQIDLAVQGMRNQTEFRIVNGHASLITTRFYA